MTRSESKLKVFIYVFISLAVVWSVAFKGPEQYEEVSQKLPSLKVDYHPHRSRFNTTKLALLVENRPLGHVPSLLLHMISVVPPEWPFLFLGSRESLDQVNASLPVRLHQETGKLRLREAPSNDTLPVKEVVNRMFTNSTFYEDFVDPAEWLFVFQTDSILCARSERSLNDWLKYDWVGAPWRADDRFGGSGGFSLRRMSRIKQVLQFQTRQDEGDAEDRWLVPRVGLLPGAQMANASQEASFGVEGVWHERPMGYHVAPDDLHHDVWDVEEHRQEIFKYCPEIKMILKMKLGRERCPPEPEPEPEPTPEPTPEARPDEGTAAEESPEEVEG
ncbi:MAG: hypothetical protein M1817_002393 [Caeruleum heppii]|nr:MAG: hypothetical protein M1817_002393 [Caeruleum heppii]